MEWIAAMGVAALMLLFAGRPKGIEGPVWLEKYRVTKHGNNPWTSESLSNVNYLKAYVDNILRATDSILTSMYRSAKVNRRAGGHPNSKHLEGLAIDIAPKYLPVETIASVIKGWPDRSEFGPITKIIPYPERGYIHIEFAKIIKRAAAS